MNVLDLFSGIGGFSLGFERAGMKTVAFCEIEKFPQKVLRKHWPGVPIYDDIRKLTKERLEQYGIGTIDVVCGGFPCQPFSAAGKQGGFKDDRDLWPEMFRVIQEVRPRWVIGENVAGFVSMGIDRTISNLESEAYEVQSFIIPACALNAPHRRDRIWIIAYDDQHSQPDGPIHEGQGQGELGQSGSMADPRLFGQKEHEKQTTGIKQYGEDVAHSESKRPYGCGEAASDSDHSGLEGGEKPRCFKSNGSKPNDQYSGGCDWRGSDQWAVEPEFRRTLDGLSKILDGGLNVNKRWIQTPCQKTQEAILSGLREWREALRPPHQWGLDGQCPLKYSNALQFLSHFIASQTGRPEPEEREAALRGLREAIIQTGAMQHTSNEEEKAWQSLSEEEKDWAILAVGGGVWVSEWPDTPRVASGVKSRVDRLKGLGNAVVPQIPEIIGRCIMEIENG